MIECKTIGPLFTNCYIISNDKKECVIIDPGMGFGKVYDYVKANYIVKAILLTHAHIDHIDGLQYFINDDIPVYIGDNEEDNLYDEEVSLYDSFSMRANPFNPGMFNVIPVSHGTLIKISDMEFKVLFTPGHTEGSVCYLFGKFLFSGDTLFNSSVGRTDFPTGDGYTLLKSLKFLIDNLDDDVIVYPGHNDITTIGQERKYNPWCQQK